jgi:hypothetical protein
VVGDGAFGVVVRVRTIGTKRLPAGRFVPGALDSRRGNFGRRVPPAPEGVAREKAGVRRAVLAIAGGMNRVTVARRDMQGNESTVGFWVAAAGRFPLGARSKSQPPRPAGLRARPLLKHALLVSWRECGPLQIYPRGNLSTRFD